MDENILRDYFEGQAEPEVLNDNLIGAYVKTGKHNFEYEIVDMGFEFKVMPFHLIPIQSFRILLKIS